MPFYSKTKLLALHIVNMISGSISCISSLIIIAMIFRSKKKLTLPYRRIIFALSSFDTISSLAYGLNLPMLPSSDNVWGSMGNEASCKAMGFMIFLGSSAVPMYNLSLCVLYVCIIICSMKQRYFTQRVEPFLHAIPILWSFIGGTILLQKEYFNVSPDNLLCWISSYPTGCHADGNVPCEKGENFVIMRYFLIAIPNIFIFAVIVITMVSVCHKVYQQEKKIRKYDFQVTNELKETTTKKSERNNYCMLVASNSKKRRLSCRLSKQTSKSKVVRNQALLFVLAYLVTWLPLRIVSGFNATKRKPPYFLMIISRATLPLQGFMNLLIYTAPFIKTLRKNHPQYSYIKSLVEVIKSSGDRL